MIFSTLGTNPCGFTRLVEALDRYSLENHEDIVIQLGYTAYKPKNLNFFSFIGQAKMRGYIKSAEIVITHGGYGCIYDCLELKKKVIAVPRKRELKECYDPGFGQEELIHKLEQENRIVALDDVKELASAIGKARNFSPNFELTNEIAVFLADWFLHARYRPARARL